MGRPFTRQEDNFLKKNYRKIPAKRMAKMLHRSEGTARQRMKILGIIVPAAIIQKFRQDSWIKPGNVPFNKGKKMPKDVYRKCKATMFKKGQLPKNTKSDGVVTLRKETMRNGEIRMYQWIRISQANWKMLHVVKWEKKHGPVPPGHIIVFKNKNTMDMRLCNLECITMEENMRRNTIHNMPPEIKKTKFIIRTLNRKINRHEKQII